MSSSRDLSLGARLVLSVALVASAWGLPRIHGVAALGGRTAVPLAAGLLALVTLLASREPLGLWPARAQLELPDVTRGLAVGAFAAAGLLYDGNVVRARQLWGGDWAATLALFAGVAAWGAALAATRQRFFWRWYAAAAVAALVPEAASLGILRPDVALGQFFAPFVFFLAADTTVALVTEELAFRRALLGPPESAGLPSLLLMAVVFGLWHAVQPGYDGTPIGSFVGTALGGFVTGCLYVLSESLPVAALYHGLHNAPLKALGGASIAAGRGGLASGVALALTAALAAGLGWMVYRRGGAHPPRLS